MTLTLEAPAVAADATRREFVLGGLALGTVLLPGCGGGSGGRDGAPRSEGYPRTVVTREGRTRIDAPPARVALTNGRRIFGFLLPFLDGARFAVVGYGNDAAAEETPWIPRRLFALPNSPDADGVEVERYAGWRPDLILANDNVGDVFDPLERVGPIVRLPETDWRETTRVLGRVFAREAVARRVIADTEAVVAEARRATPVRAAVFSRYAEGGTLGFQVRGAETPNFLVELGIEVAGSRTAEGGYEDVALELLAERLADVDYAIVLNFGDRLQRSLLDDPVLRRTEVARRGRVVALDATQTGAGFPVCPPSMPRVIDAVRPILSA